MSGNLKPIGGLLAEALGLEVAQYDDDGSVDWTRPVLVRLAVDVPEHDHGKTIEITATYRTRGINPEALEEFAETVSRFDVVEPPTANRGPGDLLA